MLRLTKRELGTMAGVLIYVAILIGGYCVIHEQTTAAATWERKYHTAKETEARAVELLGAKVREFDDYKAQVEQERWLEAAAMAQAMAGPLMAEQ
mgnify:CR=1 FL=1